MADLGPPHAQRRESPIQGRWWEGYLVRYLIGTPVGGLCVLAISYKVLEAAPNYAIYHQNVTEALNQGGVSISATTAIVFAVLALVYCYVASAPISIIHATRMFRQKDNWFNSLPRYSYLLVFIVLVGLVAMLLVLDQRTGTPERTRPVAYLIVFVISLTALWTVFAQVLCIMRLHLDAHPESVIYRRLCLLVTKLRTEELPIEERNQFVRFYTQLATEREGAAGLRESYTHLREHANSVFIAIFEISLAALIYFVLDRTPKDLVVRIVAVAAVFFVWLLPNVFLWSQANRLERSLVKSLPPYGTDQLPIQNRDALVSEEAPRQ